MIRQAISCDICGAEKRQTNHWFVAYTQGGELRVTGWNANRRMRAGSKHLCGQTCLHKLVDEFIAGTMGSRTPLAPDAAQREEPIAATDASLTSTAAYASAAPANPVPAVHAARSLQVVPAAVIAISPTRALDEPHAACAGTAFRRSADLRFAPLARRSLGTRAGTRPRRDRRNRASSTARRS